MSRWSGNLPSMRKRVDMHRHDPYIPPSKAASPFIPTPTATSTPTSDQTVASGSNSVQHNPRVPYPVSGSPAYHYGLPPYYGFLPPRSPQQPIAKSFAPSAPCLSGSDSPPSLHCGTLLPPVNSNVSNPVLASVRSAVNAPESYVKAPGASNTPTDFASIPNVPPRTPLFPEDNLPSPQITGTTTSFTFTSTLSKNPYAPLLSWKLPGRKPRLDSSFSQKMSQHTNSLISSSHLPSYTAEHNTESHDFQSTTTATPIDIDDQALFSSVTTRVLLLLLLSLLMLPLDAQPESREPRRAHGTGRHHTPVLPVSQRNSVMEMEKTPFKDHNLQDGRGRYAADRSMAADEMHEHLLDEDLVKSDPFQAAMGLVFMSRTGLR
ncbi:hypothetical protein B0H13DRAFT_1906662 [Mycena leptocephala]|nr:hypothetical protein B0H13DRAFT_1906662 [Mycena leptocephala]